MSSSSNFVRRYPHRTHTKAKPVVPKKGTPCEPINKAQPGEPRKAKRGGVEGDKNVAPKSKLRLVKTTAPTVKAPRVKKAKEPVVKSFDAAPNVIALATAAPQKSTPSAAVANKGVSKKILNALPTGFQEEADGMSVGQLKDEITVASGKIEDNKAAMREDEHLNAAREKVKYCVHGYRIL